MTDWSDKEQNPFGIKLVSATSQNVQVLVTARAHSVFVDEKGNTFACVSISTGATGAKDIKRVFRWTGDGYTEEVLPSPSSEYFVVMGWTEELLNNQIPKAGH